MALPPSAFNNTTTMGTPNPNLPPTGFNNTLMNTSASPDKGQGGTTSKAERIARRRAKTYTDKKGVLRYTSTKKPVPKKYLAAFGVGGAAPAGGSTASSVSGSSSAPSTIPTESGLPPFGSPSNRNVRSIVDSIIADATREYRFANQDAQKQARSQAQSIAGGALSLDKAIQAMGAGNRFLSERVNTRTDQQETADQAWLQSMRQNLEQSSGTGAVPMEYAATDADLAAQYTAEDKLNDSQQIAHDNYYKQSRAANVQSATEGIRTSRADYLNALQENNRALAEIKAQRAKIQADVEKQAWDTHIARRMAEAEYSQRGENIQSSQFERGNADRNYSLQEREMGLKEGAQAGTDYDRVAGILWGTPVKIEVPTGQVDANNNPIMAEQIVPSGQASNLREAVQMLAAAGLTGSRWRALAQQVMQERSRQSRDQYITNSQNFFSLDHPDSILRNLGQAAP